MFSRRNRRAVALHPPYIPARMIYRPVWQEARRRRETASGTTQALAETVGSWRYPAVSTILRRLALMRKMPLRHRAGLVQSCRSHRIKTNGESTVHWHRSAHLILAALPNLPKVDHVVLYNFRYAARWETRRQLRLRAGLQFHPCLSWQPAPYPHYQSAERQRRTFS